MGESAFYGVRDGKLSDSAMLYFEEKLGCRKRRCPDSGRRYMVMDNCAGAFHFTCPAGGSLNLEIKRVGYADAVPELYASYMLRVDFRGLVFAAVSRPGGKTASAPFAPRLNKEKNRLRLLPLPAWDEPVPFVFEVTAVLSDAHGRTLHACVAYLWACIHAAFPAWTHFGRARREKRPIGEENGQREQCREDMRGALAHLREDKWTMPEPDQGDEPLHVGDADFWRRKEPMPMVLMKKKKMS